MEGSSKLFPILFEICQYHYSPDPSPGVSASVEYYRLPAASGNFIMGPWALLLPLDTLSRLPPQPSPTGTGRCGSWGVPYQDCSGVSVLLAQEDDIYEKIK